MKTPEDLIRDLDELATTASHAALIVGLPDMTLYLWSNDPNRLDALRASIDLDGEVVGYLLVDGNQTSVFPLPELRGQEWALKHLKRLVREVVRQIKAS